MPPGEVEIALNTELSPGVVRSRKDGEFQYVIMPMRL